ncbi:hypothetical protein LSUE1_G007625 [Lachnellula suecica]|uniref:YetF C-terminal domain-containing protein n=1 Tax=Lachnellula suecica TaxID=602035 RepID=A0A8T9C2W1_9HELO|nr:hypothetical protein LSUE1_G007625 [Lachnellula suecica]
MSGTSTSGTNGTVVITGPDVLQTSDFYVKAGILHPVTVGSIAVVVLFGYLRIVNGNSLVRGLLALGTLLGFQYLTSTLSSRFARHISCIFQSPPLVLVFRGEMLRPVMKKHRISPTDVNAALRQRGVLNVCQVECAIIEPTGTISVFTMKELADAKVEPDVLTAIPAYKALREHGNDEPTDEEKAKK